jgi:hypothetical protein
LLPRDTTLKYWTSEVRRDRVEQILFGPIRDELLAPERVARMADEMQQYYLERVRAMQARASEVPHELQELAARIERLHERIRRGDPDMTIDELQAAMDRAEGKRRELEEQQASIRLPASAFSTVPRAAELYRRQVALGLAGHTDAILKARACF